MAIFSQKLTGSADPTRTLIMTGSGDVKGGFAITGSHAFQLVDDSGLASVTMTRRDDTIAAGEALGEIVWYGADSTDPGVGARIVGESDGSWTATNRNPSNLKFFVQDNSVTNTLNSAALIISASAPDSDARKQAGLSYNMRAVATDADFIAYGTGSFVGALQVGTPAGDNQWPQNQSANSTVPYQQFRVSNKAGPVQIAIDPADNSVGSIVWSQGSDGRPAQVAGWFRDGSATVRNRYSFRAGDQDQEVGAIVISDPDKTNGPVIRVGGGGASVAGSGPDVTNSLVISASQLSNASRAVIRALGPNPATNAAGYSSSHVPILTFEHGHDGGTDGNGNWNIGVNSKRTGTSGRLYQLCIANPGNSTSTPLERYRAITIDSGGSTTRVGIGAPDSIGTPTSTDYSSIIPSASLHIEKQDSSQTNTAYNVKDSQLFIRNSANTSGEAGAQITFDVSKNRNDDRYTGRIGFRNLSDAFQKLVRPFQKLVRSFQNLVEPFENLVRPFQTPVQAFQNPVQPF